MHAEYTRGDNPIRDRAVHPSRNAEIGASRPGGVLRGEDRAGQGVAEELLRAVRVPDELVGPFAVVNIPFPRREVGVDLAKLCSRPLEGCRLWATGRGLTESRVRYPSLPRYVVVPRMRRRQETVAETGNGRSLKEEQDPAMSTTTGAVSRSVRILTFSQQEVALRTAKPRVARVGLRGTRP